MIYLDYNATTPIDPEVKDTIIKSLDIYGNPSSSHKIGNEAKAIIEQARKNVAQLIDVNPSNIFFTSGGTESNNLAIIGLAYKYKKGHIITSVIEHPSVLNPLKWLQSKGFDVTYLPVNNDCMVDPEDVKKAIKRDTILITIMHSNNETGVLQPISEIGEIAKQFGIIFHTDAAQSVGKVEIKISNINVNMLTIVSHKFYGPKGIAALYVDDKNALDPIMFGAGHEKGLRPGTENILGIVGLGKASEIANRDISQIQKHMLNLRDKLFQLIENNLKVKLNGHKTLRLPNTLNISITGIRSYELMDRLKDKIALSAGAACHSGICKPSYVLKAMGLSDEDALSAIRISLGKGSTLSDIEIAAEQIIKVCKEIQS
jgi:cysteine desulfurase